MITHERCFGEKGQSRQYFRCHVVKICQRPFLGGGKPSVSRTANEIAMMAKREGGLLLMSMSSQSLR
jgi:hypothetical protein